MYSSVKPALSRSSCTLSSVTEGSFPLKRFFTCSLTMSRTLFFAVARTIFSAISFSVGTS